MSLSNLDYLYEHLPARVRRDDVDFFLWRFLHFFGEQLDGWDETFDNFYQQIAPETAAEEFVGWWLWALFGWGWFPCWYGLARKRDFYAHVAFHYARRGTRRGMEEFLRAFGIHARVFTRPQVWGQAVWGATAWSLPTPLGIVVQIDRLDDEVTFGGQFWGQAVWGQAPVTPARSMLSKAEIVSLLRFQWPAAQVVMIEYVNHRACLLDT